VVGGLEGWISRHGLVGVRACKFSSQPPAVKNLLRKKKNEKETGFPTWCLVCMYVLHVCVCNSQQTILLQAGEK